MASRLRYPELAPDGYAALSGFGHYVNTATTLSAVLLGLVNLRASQVNGCEFCIAMHGHELRKLNEPASRIEAVEHWRNADAFTLREQAALAWTETMTNLPGGSHASDEDYAAVTAFFRDKDLVDLTFAIANINAWNRMGIAFRPEWRRRSTSEPTTRSVPTPDTPNGQAADTVEPVIDAVEPVIDEDGGKVAQD